MADVPIAELTQRLWPMGDDDSAFALLDGARSPEVLPLIEASGLPSQCLYIGALDPALARVAPYLVGLSRTAPGTRALLARAWGDAWGVFLRAPVGLAVLHRHFRRLLRVQDEHGRRMLFRFYDPRVLRVYLPTCTSAELGQVFGPIELFVMEGQEPEQILMFRNDRGVLGQSEVRVEKRLHWLGDYLRKRREEEPTKP